MAFVPERPSPGGSHGAYLETKDAVYHLMSCLEGLVPRITNRRERTEVLELIGRLERMILDLMVAEEFEEGFWQSLPGAGDEPPFEDPPTA
jgi:hypothetical protein